MSRHSGQPATSYLGRTPVPVGRSRGPSRFQQTRNDPGPWSAPSLDKHTFYVQDKTSTKLPLGTTGTFTLVQSAHFPTSDTCSFLDPYPFHGRPILSLTLPRSPPLAQTTRPFSNHPTHVLINYLHTHCNGGEVRESRFNYDCRRNCRRSQPRNGEQGLGPSTPCAPRNETQSMQVLKLSP